ncbi:hypothetical protein MSU_0136 [Mycoplasma suis str. Illinois]|uniref:Uncharacterized protein n=2 Tax=Mycoplasma suis TaxID=57372 RepID=F0QQB0_MYCSL|nr:hypothetical protein MSU_0136 [Mycoplasma suis str. Illinois]
MTPLIKGSIMTASLVGVTSGGLGASYLINNNFFSLSQKEKPEEFPSAEVIYQLYDGDADVNCAFWTFKDVKKQENKEKIDPKCKELIDQFWKEKDGRKPSFWMKSHKDKASETLEVYFSNLKSKFDSLGKESEEEWGDEHRTCIKKTENEEIIVFCHNKNSSN